MNDLTQETKQYKKLPPETKAKWIQALKSNNFKQGIGALCRGEKYCCLGVLCEISSLPKNKGSTIFTDSAYLENGLYYEVYLPRSFARQNNLTRHAKFTISQQETLDILAKYNLSVIDFQLEEEEITRPPEIGATITLAYINDNGVTFSDIGRIIELEF